jgi:hypothetical protein
MNNPFRNIFGHQDLQFQSLNLNIIVSTQVTIFYDCAVCLRKKETFLCRYYEFGDKFVTFILEDGTRRNINTDAISEFKCEKIKVGDSNEGS